MWEWQVRCPCVFPIMHIIHLGNNTFSSSLQIRNHSFYSTIAQQLLWNIGLAYAKYPFCSFQRALRRLRAVYHSRKGWCGFKQEKVQTFLVMSVHTVQPDPCSMSGLFSKKTSTFVSSYLTRKILKSTSWLERLYTSVHFRQMTAGSIIVQQYRMESQQVVHSM